MNDATGKFSANRRVGGRGGGPVDSTALVAVVGEIEAHYFSEGGTWNELLGACGTTDVPSFVASRRERNSPLRWQMR